MAVDQRVPVHVIAGPLGSGKTSTIRHLLSRRPEGERWAVLVNEFGELGIDSAALADVTDDLAEVSGGCICCTTRQQMRVTLTRLLRQAHPQRLFIEPTGLGHPAGIVDLLREPGLAEAVRVAATVAVFDIAGFTEERLVAARSVRDAFELADIVVLNKADHATAAQRMAARSRAEAAYPPKAAVLVTENGVIDTALLDGAAPLPAAESPHAHGHVHGHVHEHEHAHEHTECTVDRGEGRSPWRRINGGDGEHATVAWLFPPEVILTGPALRDWFNGLPAAVVRAKGVARTGPSNRVLFNRVDGELRESDSAWRRDSRIELIVARDGDALEGLMAPLESALFDLAREPVDGVLESST